MNYLFARIAVKMMLEHPFDYEWSTQGFGMLRTYFDADKRFRLNIWDSHLAVPLCSIIHDHPWSFDSLILAGNFVNRRYCTVPWGEPTHEWQVIQTGPGGGPDGDRGMIRLCKTSNELYYPGDTYHQEPTEIHASYYTDGTITLNDRTRLPDGEHARVFWPVGSKWVDAMPRRATIDEIADVTFTALERLKHA
jgi:hypothetical protein